MAYKRKRSGTYGRRMRRRKGYPTKRRYRQRKYKRNAIRTVTRALETKRRYFNSGAVTMAVNTIVGQAKSVYQPFNWMGQATTDIGITGNAIFIRSFQLKGKIAGIPSSTVNFAGPMTFYIYLVKAQAEINTGSISEGWTEASSVVNTWFVGSTQPSQWFINSSKASILYRKKIIYNPDLNNAFDSVAAQSNAENDRASKAVNFYCKKTINRMHYFKEAANGTLEAGLFGKYYNYYWLIACDQGLDYGDVTARLQVTSLVTFKDP